MIRQLIVAPFAGAWIEITASPIASNAESTVAPFAGAWIEIPRRAADRILGFVAPFAGAWIEIHGSNRIVRRPVSRSLRGSVD